MISDEDLILISRAIDDELSPEESSHFKQRLLKEPELREVYDSLTADQAIIDDMTARVNDLPMPAAITDQLGTENEDASPFQWQMIAASFLIAVLGTALILNEPGAPSLADVLDDQSSGVEVDFEQGSITVIATFETSEGWCREYVTEAERAVACRREGSWKTQVSEPVSNENSFQTASDASAVQAFVMGKMVGQPLTATAELERLGQW